MTGPKLIVTEDGSHSLYLKDLNETYHSFHGAIRESEHIYIEKGLKHLPEDQPLRILEIGFGTGLNALLTYREADKEKRSIDYTTLEPFPLDAEIWKNLNYPEKIENSQVLFEQLHQCDWETPQKLSDHFTLTKLKCTLADFHSVLNFDLVYYDAFAPSKQPELWTLEVLTHLRQFLHKGAVLVTYCAQGQFKRNLVSLGFEVETLPGPPGKKEMVRGKVEGL